MSTQLQLVNEVLILLREDEVTSVNTNTYSKLISKFLNQAKREVEDAWDWSFLRTFALIPVVAGITTYAIPGTNKRSKISYVLENNEQYTLYKFTNEEIDYFKVMDTTTGQPYAYVTRGLSASNQMQIEIYPTPDKSYVLKVYHITPQSDLLSDGTTDSTEIKAPEYPLIYGTLIRAILERGEDGGYTLEDLKAQYRSALADAIAFDAGNTSSRDKDWYSTGSHPLN